MIGPRHPSPIALASWFDGESGDDLGPHVVACRRCRRRVDELEQIRGALRGPSLGRAAPAAAPSPRLSPRPSPSRDGHAARRLVGPVAVAAAVVLIAAVSGALSGSPSRLLDGRDAAVRTGAPPDRSAPPGGTKLTPSTPPDNPAGSGATTAAGTVERSAAPAAPRVPVSTVPPSPSAPGHRAAAPDARSLRVATVVPASGPLGSEGAAAADAVRHAVDAANRDGGVGGRPIELRIVAAEDAGGIARLRGWADAVVGGFGAVPPPGVPWILPADPSPVHDTVVPGEPTPADAGTLVAARVFSEQATGTVGVVLGDGPEAALADAFRARPSTTVARLARGSTCDSETLALKRARATTLVLALGAPDAVRCADAAARLGWDPDGGVVVAPSVPYALGGSVPLSLHGARTALGLPWPASSAPGAAHFRSAVPGTLSYRALVSFAATELVVTVARADQPVTAPALNSGTWATDLLVLDHGHNRGIKVVAAASGGWDPA